MILITFIVNSFSIQVNKNNTDRNFLSEFNLHTFLTFTAKSPEEGLIEALKYYDIKFPEIVYAQALLETGHFSSNLCINNNNLFGLYNSYKKEFYKFDNWHESVLAYKNYIQYKYKEGEDYYSFLERIRYAEDPEYIQKVKSLSLYYDKRRVSI